MRECLDEVHCGVSGWDGGWSRGSAKTWDSGVPLSGSRFATESGRTLSALLVEDLLMANLEPLKPPPTNQTVVRHREEQNTALT